MVFFLFVLFLIFFVLLLYIFREKAFRFETKEFAEDEPFVIAQKVPWTKYYNKPARQGVEEYEYIFEEDVRHVTLHNSESVYLKSRYGGPYLNDYVKLYVDQKGRMKNQRNVYIKNSCAILFSVISIVLCTLIYYLFLRSL